VIADTRMPAWSIAWVAAGGNQSRWPEWWHTYGIYQFGGEVSDCDQAHARIENGNQIASEGRHSHAPQEITMTCDAVAQSAIAP
jgi:hypothetical protein